MAGSDPAEEADGIFLPAFASEENKGLAGALVVLRKDVGSAHDQLLDNTDTINVLQEHLKNIRRDVQLASHKLVGLSQAFCKDEHSHQMDLRHLVNFIASLHGSLTSSETKEANDKSFKALVFIL